MKASSYQTFFRNPITFTGTSTTVSLTGSFYIGTIDGYEAYHNPFIDNTSAHLSVLEVILLLHIRIALFLKLLRQYENN